MEEQRESWGDGAHPSSSPGEAKGLVTNVLKLPGPLLDSTCEWPLFISDKLPNSFTVSSVIQHHHGTDQVSGHVL